MGLLDRLRSKRDDTASTPVQPGEFPELTQEQTEQPDLDLVTEDVAQSGSARIRALRQAAQAARVTGPSVIADEPVAAPDETAAEPVVPAPVIVAAQRYLQTLTEAKMEVPDSVRQYAGLDFSDRVTMADLRIDAPLILAARTRRDQMRQIGQPVPEGISYLSGLNPESYPATTSQHEGAQQS